MTTSLTRRAVVALGIFSVGAALFVGHAVADTVGANAGSVWAQIKSLETQHKMDLTALDQQISNLRTQIQTTEATLKPLQAQRDTMNKQFEDQRAALREQVSPGYLAAYQAEQQALDAAKAQHDQTISAANQQYTTARQQITAQFQSTVKGLK